MVHKNTHLEPVGIRSGDILITNIQTGHIEFLRNFGNSVVESGPILGELLLENFEIKGEEIVKINPKSSTFFLEEISDMDKTISLILSIVGLEAKAFLPEKEISDLHSPGSQFWELIAY